jgi:hypothetical protein
VPQPGEPITTTYRDEFVERTVTTVDGKVVFQETKDVQTGRITFRQKVTTSPEGPDQKDLPSNVSSNSVSNTDSTVYSRYPNSLVGKFHEQARSIGFARNNRFIVLIHGPGIDVTSFEITSSSMASSIGMGLDIKSKQRLALNCQDASFPAKALMTQESNIVGNGPLTTHAYAENVSGDLVLNFLTGADFFERHYFESWVHKIVNPGTHEVAMYDTYALPWNIIVAHLPTDFGDSTGGASFENAATNLMEANVSQQVYYVKYHHVYPIRVSEQVVSATGEGAILGLSVAFKYLKWTDPVIEYLQQTSFANASNVENSRFSKQLNNAIDKFFTRANPNDPNVRRNFELAQQIGIYNPELMGLTDPSATPNDYKKGPKSFPGTKIDNANPFTKFGNRAYQLAKTNDPFKTRQLLIERGLGDLNASNFAAFSPSNSRIG